MRLFPDRAFRYSKENGSALSRSFNPFRDQDLHIWPDFHGNRSPLSNPSLKGMILGLTLSTSSRPLEDLGLQYLAAIQAIAYGVKHIIRTLESYGHEIKVR